MQPFLFSSQIQFLLSRSLGMREKTAVVLILAVHTFILREGCAKSGSGAGQAAPRTYVRPWQEGHAKTT